jgi:hypothetical protein
MGKDEKTGSQILTLFAMLLFLLPAVSCTPMLAGQAAYQGTVAVATAAASASTEDPDKKLKDALNSFNEAFKFEDYKQASAFVTPDKKVEFWSEVDRFQGKIRLTEYELRDLQLDEKKDHATAILNVQYWRTESPVLKTVTFSQKWQYTAKDKTWRVSDIGFEAFLSNSY